MSLAWRALARRKWHARAAPAESQHEPELPLVRDRQIEPLDKERAQEPEQAPGVAVRSSGRGGAQDTLERQRHQSLHAVRCHRRTVAGRTTITASRRERVRVASIAISHRSSWRSRGRGDERRSTVSWWRSKRFSAATMACGTKTLRTAATTLRRRSITERCSAAEVWHVQPLRPRAARRVSAAHSVRAEVTASPPGCATRNGSLAASIEQRP